MPRAYLALAVAGFRRYATYRQATVAAAVTNSVFGFLRCAILFAVVDAGARVVAGYDASRLATFVWAGQGIIGVVLPTYLALLGFSAARIGLLVTVTLLGSAAMTLPS